MRKLKVFECMTPQQSQKQQQLSNDDKNIVEEIYTRYDKALTDLEQEQVNLIGYSVGYLLGLRDMELKMAGHEPNDDMQPLTSQRIMESYRRGLQSGPQFGTRKRL